MNYIEKQLINMPYIRKVQVYEQAGLIAQVNIEINADIFVRNLSIPIDTEVLEYQGNDQNRIVLGLYEMVIFYLKFLHLI